MFSLYQFVLDRASPYIGPHFFGHKSPAARELFKPYTDSASLVVKIKKTYFVLDLSLSGGNVTSRDVLAFFWPSLPGPGRRPDGLFFGRKV